MIDLYNADCLIQMDKMIAEGIKVDYSFTSPPYNRKRNDKYKNIRDDRADWLEFNYDAIDRLLELTENHIFYNIQANYYNRQDVYKIIGKYSEKIVDIHIWEKSNPMPARGASITNAVEYFLILGNRSLKSNKTYTKNIVTTSVNTAVFKSHKAVMNLSVARHFIKNFTGENDTILDCFMGLGTTGIVCKEMCRNFIGIELDNEYFNIAKERIDKGELQ